jgi:hypothetical protein
MRNRFTAISLAAFLALTVVACTNGSSSDNNGVLNPSSAPPTQTSTSDASTSHKAAPPPAGLLRFAFPASVKVEFKTALPAKGAQRAAMIGYENYVDSMWYAVVTHGSNKVYQKYVFGNALTFARGQLGAVPVGLQISGTIVYYHMSVPEVFNSASALVQSCVNASGMYRVYSDNGRRIGTIFSSDWVHFQEQVTAEKSAAGPWTVANTLQSQASAGGSAGVCQ